MSEIEKFNGRNDFHQWCKNVKAILESEGLLNTLQGEEALSNELNDDEELQLLMEKALSILQLSLSDELLIQFVDETCPAKLWVRLEDLHTRNLPRRRLHLKIRLHTLRLAEGASIKKHLEEFDEIVCGLKNVGVEVEDEDRALILLCSLPRRSYGEFVEGMLSGKGSVFSLDNVKAALRRRCRRRGRKKD